MIGLDTEIVGGFDGGEKRPHLGMVNGENTPAGGAHQVMMQGLPHPLVEGHPLPHIGDRNQTLLGQAFQRAVNGGRCNGRQAGFEALVDLQRAQVAVPFAGQHLQNRQLHRGLPHQVYFIPVSEPRRFQPGCKVSLKICNYLHLQIFAYPSILETIDQSPCRR
jgi:hypothetical protein